MESATAPTKTEQIAATLRNEIKRGVIGEGASLSGVRALAERFGVCQRSISVALEQLQRENLVIRKHGKGVFVRDWRQTDKIEVFLLLWSQYSTLTSYSEMLMAMTVQPTMPPNLRFNSRSVFDESLDRTHLAAELRNLAARSDLDCLLVNANSVTPAVLPLFRDLHLPVIFLGDFSSGDIDETDLNQVAGSPELSGYQSIEFMAWQKERETLLLIPDDTLNYKLFHKGAMRAAAELGVKVHYHCLPSPGVTPRGDPALEKVLAQITPAQRQKLPTVADWPRFDELSALVGKYRPAAGPLWVMPTFNSDSSQAFYRAVYRQILLTTRQAEAPRRFRVEAPQLFLDISNRRQWRCDQHNFTAL